MVAKNPLFVGWSLKKFKATVINDIWPEVLFFTLIALSKYIFCIEFVYFPFVNVGTHHDLNHYSGYVGDKTDTSLP